MIYALNYAIPGDGSHTYEVQTVPVKITGNEGAEAQIKVSNTNSIILGFRIRPQNDCVVIVKDLEYDVTKGEYLTVKVYNIHPSEAEVKIQVFEGIKPFPIQ